MSNVEVAPIKPLIRSPEQMEQMLEELKGQGYDLGRTETMAGAAGQEEGLIRRLKEMDPSVNGNAEELALELQEFQQEAGKKEAWYSRAYEWTKEKVGNVLSASWEFIKAHPYLTTAAVLGIAGVAAYYTGFGATLLAPLQNWISSQPDAATGRWIDPLMPDVTPTTPIDLPAGVNPSEGLPFRAPG